MSRIRRPLFVLGLAVAPAPLSALAKATLLHTWVTATGSDSANCDRPTPCASFSGAYNDTSAGGEITCVDSADYGGVGHQ